MRERDDRLNWWAVLGPAPENFENISPSPTVCEHCPNFRTDVAFRPVLAPQRRDDEVLAEDAEHRGWGTDAARHRRLVERLDSMITGTGAVS